METKVFDFDKEFRLGIKTVDSEHIRLVEMLNEVYVLLGNGKKETASKYFSETLSTYVIEHFANEEKFMESIGYPGLEEHRRIHENFKKSFNELKPLVESYDDEAFRKALTDAFTWIIGHIGKTDRKYATFYYAK